MFLKRNMKNRQQSQLLEGEKKQTWVNMFRRHCCFLFFVCILSLTSFSDFKSTKIIVYLRAYKRKLNIVAYLEGYIKWKSILNKKYSTFWGIIFWIFLAGYDISNHIEIRRTIFLLILLRLNSKLQNIVTKVQSLLVDKVLVSESCNFIWKQWEI